jgi:FG-GAP-like repeat/FG-GAP repeat
MSKLARDFALRMWPVAVLALTLLAFDGCGFTTEGSPGAVSPVYWSVAVGDLNGDGLPDIVASYTRSSNQRTSAGFVAVYLQDPAKPGTFLPPVAYPVGSVPISIAIGDLDGDGKLDIVTANTTMNFAGAGSVSVLLQDAANPGNFLAAVSYVTGNAPNFLAIGDLNGDGRLDLAVADATGISVHFSDPVDPGTFLPAITINLGTAATSVAIADLNGDQKQDLAVTTAQNVLVVLQNPAVPGTFFTPVGYLAGLRPTSIAIADLNMDGKPDLAVANEGSPDDTTTASISVLFQDFAKPGTFISSRFDVYATGRASTLVVAADLNGDTEADLVVANLESISILLHNLCRANLLLPAVNYASAKPVRSIAIGDMNDDRKPDLIITDGDGVVIRFQDPANPGVFLTPTVITQ